MTLGEVKRSDIIKFGYHVKFYDFYTKLFVRSYKQKIENILKRIFILLLGSCPRSGTLGAGWVKNFSDGMCDSIFIIKRGVAKLGIGINMEICHIRLGYIILSNNCFTPLFRYSLPNGRILAGVSFKAIILYLILSSA